MRKRDLHILTSNIYTYTGDQRFSVIHAPDSEDWDLKIEYPQKKDEGIYECQVNTEPKINLAVLLHVTGMYLKNTWSVCSREECLDLVFRTHHHKIALLSRRVHGGGGCCSVVVTGTVFSQQPTSDTASQPVRTMFPVQTYTQHAF